MRSIFWSGLVVSAAVLFSSPVVSGETIVKLNFGSTGPDVQLIDGVFSTIDDGDSAPGDQITTVDFDGFVEAGGHTDITIPNQGSFSLFGVDLVGTPDVSSGVFTSVTQVTTGGSFELYDGVGNILLTGTLTDGLLHGSSGAAATGSFFAANLGTFTGPNTAGLDGLFSMLDPDSAALSISLTDVVSLPGGDPGLLVDNGGLLNFSSDATGNISAEAKLGPVLPEPSASLMAIFGVLGLLGMRKKS